MDISMTKEEFYSIVKNAVREVIKEEKFSTTAGQSNPANQADPFLDYITDPKTAVENRFNLNDISVNHDKYIY